MKNIVFILVIAFYSCNSQKCANIDYELINEFEGKIKTVKNAQKKEINVTEYREALTYLSIRTGIMTLANYSDTIGYKNNADYHHDIKLWEKWIDENSCLLKN